VSDPEGPGPFGRRAPDPERPAPPPPPPAGPPAPPPPPARLTSQATWIAGVLAVLILAYITFNTLRTESPGSRGLEVGERMPPFAMPLATSDVEADANVAERPGEGARNAACDVRGPEILNVCELYEQGPVALVFFAEPSGDCKEQVDALDAVAGEFPQVRFAAVSVRGNRDKVREAIRERGWDIPVGWDRDGAVTNAYAVGLCPTITFAQRGGKVAGTALTFQDEAALRRRLRSL
jgi:thiol-disulfide isomerase/thioredoxin